MHIVLPTLHSDITRLGCPFLFVGHFKTIYHKFSDKIKKIFIELFPGMQFYLYPVCVTVAQSICMKGEKVFPECFAFGQKRFIFPTKVLARQFFSSNGTKLHYSAGSSMTLSFWYNLVLTLSIKIKKGKSLFPKCMAKFFMYFFPVPTFVVSANVKIYYMFVHFHTQ